MRRALIACFVILAACSDSHPRVAATQDGTLRIVVLGDSVAHGAGDERGLGISGALDHQLRSAGVRAEPVVNLGINGARTHHVRELLARADAQAAIARANIVVLSIGGNDLYGDAFAQLFSKTLPSMHQVLVVRDVRGVVDELRALNPALQVDVLGIYNPFRGTAWIDREVKRWDARLIAEFAAIPNVTVIRIEDLMRQHGRLSSLDHFHPGAAGYAAIAERVRSSW